MPASIAADLIGLANGVAGTAIVLAFAWVLGVGATLAEPSLTALGITVNRLTNGSFSPIVLRVAVPIGVGCGILSGVLVVLYEVPVTVLMFVAYPLTAWITVYCSEEFTNVAWDSAGVTTGSVTVPLVLSLGSGLSVATGARSGFGLLTMASVCPIISVLVCCFIPCLNRRPISGPPTTSHAPWEEGRWLCGTLNLTVGEVGSTETSETLNRSLCAQGRPVQGTRKWGRVRRRTINGVRPVRVDPDGRAARSPLAVHTLL